jgi:CRP-like cAMP-binding protein
MSQQKQPSGPSSSVQGSPSPSSKSNILNVISSTSDSLQSSSAVQVNATAMSTIMPLKENEDVQEIFTTERTGLEVNTALRDRYAPYLEKTNLYRCLSKKGQLTVLANIKERGFRRNDVILKQHDAAAAMYIIMQGEASVHVSKTPSFQLALNVDAVDASISKNANSMTPILSKMLSKSYSSADRKKEKSSLPMRRASNLHQSRTNPNSPHAPLKSDQRKSSLGSIDVPNAMGGMRARYGHIVKTCCPGSIFGEKSVLEEAATRSATIIALSDVVRCLVVDKSTIDNVAAQCDFLRDPLTLDDSRPISASLLTADEQKATRISEEMALKLEEIEDHIAAYFGDSSIDDAFLLEDDDGNQYLDYLEFKRLIKEKVRIQISDAEFLNLMNIYDENADGVISLVEFKLKYRVKKAEFLDFIALKQDEADRFGSLPVCRLS